MMITALLAVVLLQQPNTIRGVVLDPTGSPIAGARIVVHAGGEDAQTVAGADGRWTTSISGASQAVQVTASADGFASTELTVADAGVPIRLELRPQGIAESITVSAPGPERLDIRSSATVLDSVALENSPALMLDDQLRSVPGFSLFRRTSSRVANPTTQGVTLRGLSASGASRTLVLLDGVPLNDPFGAWVAWDRVPAIALDRVEVVRGASSDTHGNDALGGVIRLSARTRPGVHIRTDVGGQGTRRASGYAATIAGPVLAGLAVEAFTTGGYITVAPEVRGLADIPATDRSRTIVGWIGAQRGSRFGLVRGGYLREDRGNGTPQQVNGTVTRWGAATARGFVFGGAWDARVDLNTGNYRQTFSAVAAGRATERLTNLQWVRPRTTGLGSSWVRSASRWTTLVAATARVSRADLEESTATASGAVTVPVLTPARQRDISVALQERVELSPRLVLEAGMSGGRWRSSRRDISDIDSGVGFIEPRVSLSLDLHSGRSLRVAWLSGFRTPTMNELYRSFRVGNTITQANSSLEPEESSGPEIAFTVQRPRWIVRLVGYEAHLSGAIYNRTLSATSALIQRVRTNGDASAAGAEVEAEWRPRPSLALTTAWAATRSRFTSGELDGRHVPQVPRLQGAVGLRTTLRAFSAGVDVRVVGSQFDDDVNVFKLRAGSLVDARAGWRATRHVDVFVAVENALDRELDTGRTPIRTVGSPRVGRAGVTLKF